MTRLEVISDVVCPWCYLGAANLMRAVTAREGHPFAIRWRPYQLDPAIPAEGMDRTDYMTRKFGDPGAVEGTHERLEEMGREAGISFRFAEIRRAPNTLDAHRLIRWAEPEGLQTRTAMALFRRYFELGRGRVGSGRAQGGGRGGRDGRRGGGGAAGRGRRPGGGRRRRWRRRARWG